MSKLKQHLLSLDYFIDNEYLDFYCSLIEQNKNRIYESGKTEQHHIIPRAIFRLQGFESESKAPNKLVNKNNLVNLLYRDHLLAHFYLCKCAKEDYKKLACFTFTRMVSQIDKDKRPTLDSLNEINLEEYEKLKYLANLYMVENKNIRNKHIFKDDIKRIDLNEVIEYYIKQNHTITESIKKFNTTKANLLTILRLNNIYKNKGFDPNLKNIITKDVLEKYYIIENHTWDETVKFFGISQDTLSKLLKNYNLKKLKVKNIV